MAGIHVPGGGHDGGTGTLDHALPAPIVAVIRATYGDDIAHIFLISAVIAVVGVRAALALPRITLRTSVDLAASGGAAAADAPDLVNELLTAGNHRADGEPYQGAHAVDREPAAVAPVAAVGGAVVVGRVEGPDRRPVAGALLTVTDYPGHQVAREVSAANGGFRLSLPSGGSYLLICAAEDHQPMATMLSVGLGETRRDIALAGGQCRGGSGRAGAMWCCGRMRRWRGRCGRRGRGGRWWTRR